MNLISKVDGKMPEDTRPSIPEVLYFSSWGNWDSLKDLWHSAIGYKTDITINQENKQKEYE